MTIADVLSGAKRWHVECGDCIDLMRAMPDKQVVIVTDVPYQVGKKIANDDLPWEEYLPWLDARLVECCRVAKRVFTFFATTRLIRFVRETTVPPAYPVVWDKPFMLHTRTLNGSPFMARYEPILYWGPMRCKESGKRGYDAFSVNALWPKDRAKLGIEHPTPKPFDLLYQALQYWTDPDDIVLDPFCGGGTHLAAALRLGRRCIGIDIDPQWADASRRWCEAEESGLSLRDVRDGQRGLFNGLETSAPKRPAKAKRARKKKEAQS